MADFPVEGWSERSTCPRAFATMIFVVPLRLSKFNREPWVSKPKLGKPVRGSRTGKAAMVFLDLLGRRWVLRIIWEFQQRERMSFNELQARCGGISPSVLSQRLRDLCDNKLMRVEETGWYSLTELGKELGGPLATLGEWTKRWAKELGRSKS